MKMNIEMIRGDNGWIIRGPARYFEKEHPEKTSDYLVIWQKDDTGDTFDKRVLKKVEEVAQIIMRRFLQSSLHQEID